MTITVGTTPVNLLQFLRGVAFAGASLPAGYPANPYQRVSASRIVLMAQPGNTDKVYFDTQNYPGAPISSTNYGFQMPAGDRFTLASGVTKNSILLSGIWFVGGAATQLISFYIEYD